MKFIKGLHREFVSYKTDFSEEKLKKFKNEGILLNIGEKTLRLKESKEIFKAYFKKPNIFLSHNNDEFVNVSFNIENSADKVFIDFKHVDRYSSSWQNLQTINNSTANTIYEISHFISPGQANKYRVTYFKNENVFHSEVISEDPLFKFSYDPPEIMIHKGENILLYLFNLNRFTQEGYVQIFKKENEETETCIYNGRILGKYMKFEDLYCNSMDFYEYRAEIYDNLGNRYNTDVKKINYQKRKNVLKLNIEYNEKTGVYSFKKESEDMFKIEKYNIETESSEIINYNIERIILENKKEIEKVYFTSKNTKNNEIISVEGYDSHGMIISSGILEIITDKKVNIFEESITRNSKYENVLKWKYEGDVDHFVVYSRNKLGIKILDTISHRISPKGYIFFVDDNSSKERITTEYIIVALDEFGNILERKRMTGNGA